MFRIAKPRGEVTRAVWLSVALVIFVLPGVASAKSVALVIGNSQYENAPLKNASNDAKGIANVLTALGFETELKIDLTRRAFKQALRDFYSKLQPGDTALFYYAGHGIQSQGVNFLIPLDSDVEQEFEIEDEAVSVKSVLRLLGSSRTAKNLIILDACRNNPLERSFGRSASRGLARIDSKDIPNETLIFYSTKPGQIAEDGEGRNSIFTASLIEHLQSPGLSYYDIRLATIQDVKARTGGQQYPWAEGALSEKFYFSKETQSIDVAMLHKDKGFKGSIRNTGDVFQDKFNDGGLGPKMVVIDAGSFILGSRDHSVTPHERPPVQVALDKKFAIGQTEVTFELYDQFTKETGGKFAKDYGWGRGKRPVVGVTQNEIREFLTWFNAQTDYTYRLPTEAEWEYVAKAGTDRAYPFSDDKKDSCKYANTDNESFFGDKSCKDGFKYTAPVGSFRPNFYGVYDLHGNVAEFVGDCWIENYERYLGDGITNIFTDCVNKVWSVQSAVYVKKSFRTVRGGSFKTEYKDLRVTNRVRIDSHDSGKDMGFRLARDL